MAVCNQLRFHFCPETLVLTVKGEDLDLISDIYSEICVQNLHRSFRPRNSYVKPFLPRFPDGTNGMSRTKDSSGVGTLSAKCTSLKTYFAVLCVVSEEFKVTCPPGQNFSGTIEGMRDRGMMASALVSSYEWPIFDGSPEINSSADAIEFAKLEV
jgi:hypothetical protein